MDEEREKGQRKTGEDGKIAGDQFWRADEKCTSGYLQCFPFLSFSFLRSDLTRERNAACLRTLNRYTRDKGKIFRFVRADLIYRDVTMITSDKNTRKISVVLGAVFVVRCSRFVRIMLN